MSEKTKGRFLGVSFLLKQPGKKKHSVLYYCLFFLQAASINQRIHQLFINCNVHKISNNMLVLTFV